jgi:hypothetical protein
MMIFPYKSACHGLLFFFCSIIWGVEIRLQDFEDLIDRECRLLYMLWFRLLFYSRWQPWGLTVQLGIYFCSKTTFPLFFFSFPFLFYNLTPHLFFPFLSLFFIFFFILISFIYSFLNNHPGYISYLDYIRIIFT